VNVLPVPRDGGDKEVRMSKQTLGACVLFLPVVVGLMGIANAHLTTSTMNRVVGGCDECNQWTNCTFCDSAWEKCSTSALYVECHDDGEDPSLGCGECESWEAGCGYWQTCYDENCEDCDGTTTECSGCNRLKSSPPYETCPGW
jgi:hypothetical protein